MLPVIAPPADLRCGDGGPAGCSPHGRINPAPGDDHDADGAGHQRPPGSKPSIVVHGEAHVIASRDERPVRRLTYLHTGLLDPRWGNVTWAQAAMIARIFIASLH